MSQPNIEGALVGGASLDPRHECSLMAPASFLLPGNSLRRSVVQFNLSTHFLNLLSLIFRARDNIRDFFLQLGDCGLESVALLGVVLLGYTRASA